LSDAATLAKYWMVGEEILNIGMDLLDLRAYQFEGNPEVLPL